jgi:hypothetical protein
MEMFHKALFFYNTIFFVLFLLGLLLISINSILSLIWLGLVVGGQIFVSFMTKLSFKKPIWNEKILKKNIVAHCDGIVESITIVENILNFSEAHYAIKIINSLPFYNNRVSPIAGSILINNHIKNKQKLYQLESTIINENITITIGDNSFQKKKGIIDIIPNTYLINDFIELFSFQKEVKVGDWLWAMYFHSESTIFIPVAQGTPLVIEGQTVIHGETLLYKLK